MKRKAKYKNKYKHIDNHMILLFKKALIDIKLISRNKKLYSGIGDCFFIPIQYINISQLKVKIG